MLETASAPVGRRLYYGGGWHHPVSGRYVETVNPGTNEPICAVADAGAPDVDAAVEAARAGFKDWREIVPLERGRIIKAMAQVVRENARELATLDAANCGNPVREMAGDAAIAAAQLDFFAGLVTEMKGDTIPMGPDALNLTVRQPLGVVARILAFNHPFMFCAGKMAAPWRPGTASSSSRRSRRRCPPSGLPSSSAGFCRMASSTSSPAGARRARPWRRIPVSTRSRSSAASRPGGP